MAYIGIHCFSTLSRRQDPRDPFRKKFIVNISKLLKKTRNIIDKTYDEIFSNFNNVLCADSFNHISENLNVTSHEVLIVETTVDKHFNVRDTFKFNNIEYKLVSLITTFNSQNRRNDDWDG